MRGTPAAFAARAVASSASACMMPCTPIGARNRGEGYLTPNNVVCKDVSIEHIFQLYTDLETAVCHVSQLPRDDLPLIVLSAIRMVGLVCTGVSEHVVECIC